MLFTHYLKRNIPVKIGSFEMMNSNGSVKLLYMIQVLLNKTSIDRINLDQF